jgi:ABC-type Fe3+ transport system permease subunit
MIICAPDEVHMLCFHRSVRRAEGQFRASVLKTLELWILCRRVCAVGLLRERICVRNFRRYDQMARGFTAKALPYMRKSSDPWSIVVIVLTVALFILALFVKGFTKGLLVECGVLLVSIKLILMAKKTAVIEENLEQRLDRIEKLLAEGREQKSG